MGNALDDGAARGTRDDSGKRRAGGAGAPDSKAGGVGAGVSPACGGEGDDGGDGGDGLYARAAMLSILVAVSLGVLYFLFTRAPSLSMASGDAGTPCSTLHARHIVHALLPVFLGGTGDLLSTAKALWACAEAYRAAAPVYTVTAYSVVYVLAQAFAIPGPLLLSIVAGAMYGPWKAQALIALCATTGATMCYFISDSFGRPLLLRCIPTHLRDMRQRVRAHRSSLFWYMLFLRLTPACPNWLVNVASPLVGVPAVTFITSTACGLLPANFFHASTGAALATLTSWRLRDNMTSFITLFVLQLVALTPTLWQRCRGGGDGGSGADGDALPLSPAPPAHVKSM